MRVTQLCTVLMKQAGLPVRALSEMAEGEIVAAVVVVAAVGPVQM